MRGRYRPSRATERVGRDGGSHHLAGKVSALRVTSRQVANIVLESWPRSGVEQQELVVVTIRPCRFKIVRQERDRERIVSRRKVWRVVSSRLIGG